MIEATSGPLERTLTREQLPFPFRQKVTTSSTTTLHSPGLDPKTAFSAQADCVCPQESPAGALRVFDELVNRMITLFEKVLGLIQELAAGKAEEPGAAAPEAQARVESSSEESAAANTGRKSSTLRKSGEFLWKPASSKDGKLAVLLPSRLTGSVARVRILSPNGKDVLARGKFSGVGNGSREHYRFDKAGDAFPAKVKVEIVLKDGTSRTVIIKKPAQRFTV